MNIISKIASYYSKAPSDASLISARLPRSFTALCFPGRASATKSSRGTISGTVTDSTGAVVKDAQVTITETSTGTVNRTKSDGAGPEYVIPFLQPGEYPDHDRG